MKRYIIVVAGGKGTRMGGDIPKQFQLLAGKPLLMVTLEHLHALDSALQIILSFGCIPPFYQFPQIFLTSHLKSLHRT